MNEILEKLEKSKFRSKFDLSLKDKEYIKQKGMDVIERHAKDFIAKRIALYPTKNDTKQTPWHGHPVFIAQHATATCCRSCLEKWHHIPKDRELTQEEQDFIVSLIMAWIKKKMG